eukprot:TRINITY_DN1298_c0_g3_i1.p1 TRINITY_DN1298_c0_g3~~TRINITY_DN1298_c0_g3_i1.p1  ORF type:complete len:349 (+),score=53.18 TRINITY_DN1298_c0_g3_i1:1385-2431(+)
MDRLLNLKLLPYLLEILMTNKDREFIEITLKTILTLTQWTRIADFNEPLVISKLKALKNEDELVGNLAQRVLAAFDSNPKPSPTRRWPELNLAALEPLLVVNFPEPFAKPGEAVFSAKPERLYAASSKRVLQPSSNESNNVEIAGKGQYESPAINYYRTKECHPNEYIRRGYKANISLHPLNAQGQMSSTANEYNGIRNATPLKKPKFTTDYSANRLETTSGRALNLPLLSEVHTFDPKEYAEPVEQIYEKYMDTDLTEKLLSEGKIARKMLGLGVIEAAGVKRATGCGSVRKLVEWYASAKDYTKAYSLILYGVITMKKADKVMSILHLIVTMKMGYAVRNPHVVNK